MSTLPAGTRQIASASYLDAGGERGSFKLYGKIVTAENADDQATAWALVLSKADAMVLGARVRDSYDNETTYAVSRPTNGAAREIALKCIFRSAATGQTWEALLPTLNLAKISYDPNYGAKDVVLLTTTDIAALVSALNAFPIVNPYDASGTDLGTMVGAQVVRGLK